MRISDWSSDVCSSDLLDVACKGDDRPYRPPQRKADRFGGVGVHRVDEGEFDFRAAVSQGNGPLIAQEARRDSVARDIGVWKVRRLRYSQMHRSRDRLRQELFGYEAKRSEEHTSELQS